MFRREGKLVAGGVRVYVGAGVIHPSNKFVVEGLISRGISLSRLSDVIKKIGCIRVYVESEFSREVCEATLEHALYRLLKLKGYNEIKLHGWKRLFLVNGSFPTINSSVSLELESRSISYNVVAVPMEGLMSEFSLERDVEDFIQLSRLYTKCMRPSSSICRLIDYVKPIAYSYNGTGLYMVVERWKLIRCVEELLKIFDPDNVKVYGLDRISCRIYTI